MIEIMSNHYHINLNIPTSYMYLILIYIYIATLYSISSLLEKVFDLYFQLLFSFL